MNKWKFRIGIFCLESGVFGKVLQKNRTCGVAFPRSGGAWRNPWNGKTTRDTDAYMLREASRPRPKSRPRTYDTSTSYTSLVAMMETLWAFCLHG